MGMIQPVVLCSAVNTQWSSEMFTKALQSALTHVDKKALPVVLGSEFLFGRYDGEARRYLPLQEADGRWQLLEVLIALSANALVVPGTVLEVDGQKRRNYAPVYFQKKLVQKVFKATKGGNGEYDWEHNAIGVASEHPDSFVLDYHESSETRFGVEICNDIGEMKGFLGTKSMSVWPEVYLMPSYGMATDDINVFAPGKAGYMVFDQANKMTLKNQKYTLNLDPDAREHVPSILSQFALHQLKPGMFIQSDGFRCRVGYKHPMGAKFTMVPPLKSYAVQNVAAQPSGDYSASVHVFPAVDLNPLKPFWA